MSNEIKSWDYEYQLGKANRLAEKNTQLLSLNRELVEALEPLLNIWNAYEANELDDEARRFHGLNSEHENTKCPSEIELYQGRGGKELLTLANCLIASRAIQKSKQIMGEK